MKAGHHIVSISLGGVAEPSGLAVVQPRTEFSEPDEDGRRDSENHFDVTWLERFPAGRPVPAIAARAHELMADKRLVKNCSLLLDITSTGAAPVKVFEGRGVYPKKFDLASAAAEEQAGHGPKKIPLRDVIGTAQVILQTGRLKVASGLELAGTLVTDLTAFDPKAVARTTDLRGGQNADLVLALAVALHWADRLTWGDRRPRRDRPASLGMHGWMAM